MLGWSRQDQHHTFIGATGLSERLRVDTSCLYDLVAEDENKQVDDLEAEKDENKQVDEVGYTKLMRATTNNENQTASELLTKGSLPFWMNQYGTSAWVISLQNGNSHLSRLFLAKEFQIRKLKPPRWVRKSGRSTFYFQLAEDMEKPRETSQIWGPLEWNEILKARTYSRTTYSSYSNS
jgi:ankyrin repeat protein